MAGKEVKVGGPNEVARVERRSSVSELREVLQRATLSPFHSKYKALVPSSSESSYSSASGSHSNQENGFLVDLSSGVDKNGSTNLANPFVPPVQNGTKSKARNSFFPAPETKVNGLYKSSASINPFIAPSNDSNISTVDAENNILPSVKNSISSGRQNVGWPGAPASSVEAVDPWKADFSPVSPAENSWAVFPPPFLNQEPKKQQPTTPTVPMAAPSWLLETPQTGAFSHEPDIFQPYKANKENGISQDVVASKNTEPSSLSSERDYLLEYVLANQKNEDVDTIPSSERSESQDAFRFFPPPVMTHDIFQTPDIFTDVPTSESNDIFQTPFSKAENGPFQSTPLFQTATSVPIDIKSFDPLSDNYSVNNGQEKLQDSDFGELFTTPGSTNYGTAKTGIFQDASKVESPQNTADSGLMFKRSPPKPAPRMKVRLNSIQPSQTPSTFTSRVPTNFQNQLNTPAEEKNNNKIYEDVLLIGQERCVEDWPEDSPELSSDYKPPGKLKLRRDSLRITTGAEGALSTENLGKKHSKMKVNKKLRASILSRRGSKEKMGNDLKVPQTGTLDRKPKEKTSDNLYDTYGGTLPWGTKFHDVPPDNFLPSEPVDHNAVVDSKPVKQKSKKKLMVPQLRYKKKSIEKNDVFKNESGQSGLGQASKEDLLREVIELQNGGKLGTSEDRQHEMKDFRPKEPLLFKNTPFYQPASGTEPDLKNMNDFLFVEETKENRFVNTERDHPVPEFPGLTFNEEAGATGYTPSWESKVGYEDDVFTQKGADHLTPSDSDGKRQEMQDCRPKKPSRIKVPHLSWKSSKSTVDEGTQNGASHIQGSDLGLESEEYNQQRKPPILMVPPLTRRDSQGPEYPEPSEKGADLFKAGDFEDAENWMEEYSPDTKPQKIKSPHTPSRESKVNDQALFAEDLDPPGATSGDYFLSEAAKAEWMSSQMDVRRLRGPEDEERLEGVEEEEEGDGDTDSLMEWWNTVEQWDELPSEEEISLLDDETKSFTEIAGKVHRGLRVFYKVFTEQGEVLYQHVLILYAIADDISNFHHRAKIANITGGTTTAVGGVAAIAGLALAPVTLGASLIVSAVGLGVATAGGIAAASAAISDNVNDMNDRKKIEVVVQDYEVRLKELQHCLHFVVEGIRRLRSHPLLRRNNYYAGDWEVRRALQTVSLVSEPAERAEELVDNAMMSLNSVCKGMDRYFTKDSKQLKKGCKKEVTSRVRMLAKQLQDGLVELNSIREQLLDASGNI